MSGKQENDPLPRVLEWLDEARKTEPNDPDAMTLATVDARGQPSARMVLLKGVDSSGFVFYTNLESQKGRELRDNPRAALLFHWKSLRRQIRVEGAVSPVTDAEADEYFASRPRGSRIGAWASTQSRPLEGMFELEKQVAVYTAKFGLGEIPRPPHWSGFRLTADRIEFWKDGRFRLHERIVHTREGENWTVGRLYP